MRTRRNFKRQGRNPRFRHFRHRRQLRRIKQAAQAVESANATLPATLSQEEQLAHSTRRSSLALLRSANDPAQLLNLVRTLGAFGKSGAAVAQTTAADTNNLSNPIPTGAQVQVPAQTESQAQPVTLSTTSFQDSSPPAASGFETNSPATASQAIPASPIVTDNAANAVAQFQELQTIFQSAENAQDATSVHNACTSSLSILA